MKNICIRKFSGPYLSLFSSNAGKYGLENLRIRTLFTQLAIAPSTRNLSGTTLKGYFAPRFTFQSSDFRPYTYAEFIKGFSLGLLREAHPLLKIAENYGKQESSVHSSYRSPKTMYICGTYAWLIFLRSWLDIYNDC